MNKDIIVIGASAGGFDAMKVLAGGLPPDLKASIFAVLHIGPYGLGTLPEVLGRAGRLPASNARDGEPIRPGRIYVAPPDRHLLVNRDGSISLTQTELVHFVRPSADLLFESVAASYKKRAIAVVLTGTGSDGSMGLAAVKKMGGTIIAQSEGSAEFFGMPGAAIHTGTVDFVLPLEEIAPAIITLVGGDEV